jgi:hypothetical protein
MNHAIYILLIYHMQITGVVGLLVGLSIILFEIFPEESVWSIPVRQADEHMIAVPASGGLSLFLGQKQEAHKTLTKEQQRYCKRILIVDDDADLTITFKAVIEESNNNNDVNKRIEVYTSNDPVVALSEFKPNFYDLLLDLEVAHMNEIFRRVEDELSDILAIGYSLLPTLTYPLLFTYPNVTQPSRLTTWLACTVKHI